MSGTIAAKLAEMGVTLAEAPAPAANYVPYVVSGNLVYISGQVSQGPDGFITYVRRSLRKLGLRGDQVHAERFAF